MQIKKEKKGLPGIAIRLMNKWSSWCVNTLKGCSADEWPLQTRRWPINMLTNVIRISAARNGRLDTNSIGRPLPGGESLSLGNSCAAI